MPLTLSGLAWALVSIAVAAEPAPIPPARRTSFKTADGWTIAARHRPARGGRATLVLVHGAGSAGAEWERLASRLAADGVGTLALDLRGHGGSAKGPRGAAGYEGFDAATEWARAVADLRAAAAWLEARGTPSSKIAFGGASIGANLASVAAAERPSTPFLVLLSPGADYRGAVLAARAGLKTLAAASPQDRYAAAAVAELSRRGLAAAVEAPAGHGVQMLDDRATFDRLVRWIAEAAR